MLFRVLESVHGHLGVLALAALIHPAILLRKGKPLSRRNRYAVIGSTLFAVLAFASGIVIYEQFRAEVKRPLFSASLKAGLMFETKEHIAFAVCTMSLGALVCALVAPKQSNGLRRAAALTYALAASFCIVVAGLGTYVASVRGFWG